MRIWILTSEFPPYFSAGIARYVRNYAEAMGQRGHDVAVITPTDRQVDETVAKGVRLVGFVPGNKYVGEISPTDDPERHPAYPHNVIGFWPGLSFQIAQQVIDRLNRLPPPDVIESQEYGALPYYLLLRKLTERTALDQIPILLHLHTPRFILARLNHEPAYRFPQYWVGEMEKFCIIAADAVLSPSRSLAERVQEAVRHQLVIRVIPYPCAVPEATPLAAKPGHLVYVGRLEKRKGVLELAGAASRLWEDGLDFTLTLVGGDCPFAARGTTIAEILRRKFARWVANGRLRLAGEVPYAKVLEEMRGAWAVVVPSLFENYPNTCMEAMATGQLVLASRSGGQAEMIEQTGENGLLFDCGIKGDLERRLREVVAMPPQQRSRMAQNAQRRIRSICAPDIVIEQRLAHLADVTRRYKPRALFPVRDWNPAEEVALERSLAVAQTRVDGKETTGLLSVVIPFYNLGAYVSETLSSVARSSYQPLEVIVVNDGSTDPASVRALQALEGRGAAGIRIVHTPNEGLALARNAGARAAQGQYLTFLDADDLVEPEFFERAVAVLQRYPNVAFVYSWLRYFEDGSGIWPTWNVEMPCLLGHNMLSAFVVIRRSAFLRYAQNSAEMEYGLEDHEGWISLAEAGAVGVSLPFPLVRYRVRTDSMTRTLNPETHQYLFEVISERHRSSYERWGPELFNLQNANGPGSLWTHPVHSAVAEPDPCVLLLHRLLRTWAVRFIARHGRLKAWALRGVQALLRR